MVLHTMKHLFLSATWLRLATCLDDVSVSSLVKPLIYVWSETTVTPSSYITTMYTTYLSVMPSTTSIVVTPWEWWGVTPTPYVTSIEVLLQSSGGGSVTAAPTTSTSTAHSSLASVSLSDSSFLETVSSSSSSPQSSSKSVAASDSTFSSSPGSVSTSSSVFSISSSTSITSTPTPITIPITAKGANIGIIAAVVAIGGIVVAIVVIGLCCWCNRRYKLKHGVSYFQKSRHGDGSSDNVALGSMNLTNNAIGERYGSMVKEKTPQWYDPKTDILSSIYPLTTARPSSSQQPLDGQTIAADEFYNIKLEPHIPQVYGTASDITEFYPGPKRSAAPPIEESSLNPKPLNIKKTERPESIWVDDTRHSVTSNYDRNTIPGTEFFTEEAPRRSRSRYGGEDVVDTAYKEQAISDTAARLDGRDPIAERAQRELDKKKRAKQGREYF